MSFEELADRFREVRLALNRLSDQLLNLDEEAQPSLPSVNETLFSQIQRFFERTYAQVGINLEDCLIDRAAARSSRGWRARRRGN